MRENGTYTIIDQMEIEFVKDIHNNYFLRSKDSAMRTSGFKDIGFGVYVKPIKEEDMGECYRLKNWAIYRGYKSMFEWEKSDKVILFLTDDKKFAEEHDYKVVDNGRYALRLSVDDVEFTEERTPYVLK